MLPNLAGLALPGLQSGSAPAELVVSAYQYRGYSAEEEEQAQWYGLSKSNSGRKRPPRDFETAVREIVKYVGAGAIGKHFRRNAQSDRAVERGDIEF